MLRISYLGTKPPVTAVATYSRDLDYDKIDEEHKILLQKIRESQTEGRSETSEVIGILFLLQTNSILYV
jgi:hypothetical protein